MKLYPVALFCYDRVDHLQKTISSLRQNKLASDTVLYVFIDGPKGVSNVAGVNEVRDFVMQIDGFKNVYIKERAENYGLKKSIIAGVGHVSRIHGAVIVLEDDIVTTPYFLKYMNECLNLYKERKEVYSVSGFSYINRASNSCYVLRQPMCWGWATWEDRWLEFCDQEDYAKLLSRADVKKINYLGGFNYYSQFLLNQSGRLDSWYIYWYLRVFTQHGFNIYPDQSLCKNIGFDGTGTNSSKAVDYNSTLSSEAIVVTVMDLKEDPEAYKLISDRLQSLKPPIRSRIINRVRRLFFG